MPELVGFVGSHHKDRSVNFDAQRCINMFPQVSASGTAKSPAKLVSCPGLEVFSDMRAITNRGVRGAIVNNDVIYAVVGPKVIKVTQDGVPTEIATIPFSDAPVSMAKNGVNVVFVTGPEGYSIDPATDIVTQITDASFAGADAIYFVTGSYVFNKPGTSQFWAMNPYALTIDPLWFATAESAPDALVTLAVVNEEVWLFGTETTEVWTNDGTSGFPYSRIPGAVIEQGCAAKNSVGTMNGSLFWLAASQAGQGEVFQSNGLNADKISNFSLEQELATYSRIDDAVGYCYTQEGHHFYVLSFPTQNVTWVYDTTAAAWHQRGYLEPTGRFSRHRSNCHIFFDRKSIVGDWSTGLFYNMSTLVYSDNGNPLLRLRASPHVSANNQKIAHVNVEFDIETGVGLQSGQGSDPKVMLRWSDDYGHTFYGQRQAPAGKVGEYKTRVRFTRLGQARDRVYELSYSEPTPFTIIGARINATQ